MIEIPSKIKCLDLRLKIEVTLKKKNFDICYGNKLFTKEKNKEILNLNQGDIIHLMKSQKKIHLQLSVLVLMKI